jgi:hypothetical protein
MSEFIITTNEFDFLRVFYYFFYYVCVLVFSLNL